MGLTGKEKWLYRALSVVTRPGLGSRALEVRGRSQWSGDRLEEFRLARCREMLAHAGAHVPYYRDLFCERGFDPAAFRSFDQLRELPVLGREVLTGSFDRLRSEAAETRDLIRVTTGGTTGDPVAVLLERRNVTERLLVTHRLYAMMGRTLGCPTLLIAGSPIDSEMWNSARDRLKNRVMNVSIRSSFELTSSTLASLIDEIESGRYRFVIGYSSVFDLMSEVVERRGRAASFPRIIPTAELITHAQRERWTRMLGAEIFELYGAREMNSIAAETEEHDGLAVSSDLYHLEIVDSDGRPVPDDSPGIITLTSLIECGMPLIRYQLGDAGVVSPPPPASRCAFPRLRITHGRVLDVICCPDGKQLPGEFFPHLMKEVADKVRRFQVVQTDVDALVVRVVRGNGYDDGTTRYLTDRIRVQVGEGMNVEFEFVDRIATSASGKYRPTVNLVPPDRRRLSWD